MKNIKGLSEISDGVVLADFWATWCGPCKQMAPILDEVAEETGTRLVKLDVQEHQELVETFGVKNVPTLMLLKDGKPRYALVGSQTKGKILEWLQMALTSDYDEKIKVYKAERE